jgi:hypothetical protein
MVGLFEELDAAEGVGLHEGRPVIWRRDTQGKFYGTLLRKPSASLMNNPG